MSTRKPKPRRPVRDRERAPSHDHRRHQEPDRSHLGLLLVRRYDCSDGRIKTCIQKQINLVKAIGRSFPGVTGTTPGRICDEVGTWAHEKLKAAMKDLYGFASVHPDPRTTCFHARCALKPGKL